MNSMRVLWLMNEPLPDFQKALGISPKAGGGGGWMTALSQALADAGNINLGVAAHVPYGKVAHYANNGIEHFSVPTSRSRYGLLRPTVQMVHRYQEIVSEFSPDVIHVHGTEWYGGIVTADNQLGRPTLISIQGLIDHYIHHLTGHLELVDILKSRTLRNWVMFDGIWKQKARWKKRAAVEREIIRCHNAFIGRTLWDRAHLRRLNQNAHYFHCHEMVRKEFFDRKWSLSSVNRHTIFAPSAAYPLKGFHVLLKALAILKREFPDVRVRVPLATFSMSAGIKGLYKKLLSSDYTNYLVKLIDQLSLKDHIMPLGQLSGEAMAREMSLAHVFTLNAFVENSPNTMAEALTIGVPSVVSLAGGIPSLIDEGKNVLGYPLGDEAVLAEQIRNIFINDELANRLSEAGRELARPRYSSEPIVRRMTDIYRSVIKGEISTDLEKSIETVQ